MLVIRGAHIRGSLYSGGMEGYIRDFTVYRVHPKAAKLFIPCAIMVQIASILECRVIGYVLTIKMKLLSILSHFSKPQSKLKSPLRHYKSNTGGRA